LLESPKNAGYNAKRGEIGNLASWIKVLFWCVFACGIVCLKAKSMSLQCRNELGQNVS
jgi:hypothetical protein